MASSEPNSSSKTSARDSSSKPAADATERSARDLLADRRRKLDRLREEFGVDPYGRRIDGLIPIAEARAQYDEAADQAHKDNADPSEGDRRPRVAVAGRVMQHRVMGNLIFMQLRDSSGDLQLAVSKKAVGQPAFSIAKATDYGDLVVASGPLAKTKTGEITVWAEQRSEEREAGSEGQEPPPHAAAEERSDEAAGPSPSTAPPAFSIAAKSLALPPGKHHGLTDPEQRYRKRYVDLYANPEVMRTMRLRSRIIEEMRSYLRERGFLEVETPMLQPIHGGAAARPFETHHHALDMPLYLRIAPELYLKRLLVGGMPKVFEINRNFRNEGLSPRHNPEFTMLEAYEAYGNWETMAELVEDMVCTVAEKVFGTLKIQHGEPANEPRPSESGPGEPASGGSAGGGSNASEEEPHAKPQSREGEEKTIDLSRPWRRVPMVELVEEWTGWKFEKVALSETEIDRLRSEFPGKDLKLDGNPAEQLTEVFEKVIEPTLLNPTFVTRVPGEIIPLARRCADDDYFADVYELAINGVEISPGYTELNDPDAQEAQFRQQVGDEAEQQRIDENFLEALRVGMPPAGGMGLGIDRLVMMLTGEPSIRDVILFPLMRPAGS